MSLNAEFNRSNPSGSSSLEPGIALPDRLAARGYFINPVSPRSSPDPYVLKHRGEYWAYSTGFQEDGRCFGVLHSTDLVNWENRGGAMDPLPGGATCYWAPEVVYLNGRFYMYYSVGNEELMEIRVAVAEHPGGPFIDGGVRLTREPFAIDAHLFEDDDGARYLFYATDFLEHSHVGTGTVYDRMLDPFTLAGQPRPVIRACYDWQVYDPQRASKGGVRWHTVEGPFVLKRKGWYYEMFSGGNWQNISYGVSYGISDTIGGEGEWVQACDGMRVLPILRTIPGKVIGPGHNSAVPGPNNREWFCIYHRWTPDNSARVLCIDRMDWAGDRLLVIGPTSTAQPMPFAPTVAGFGTGADGRLAGGWRYRGAWNLHDGVAAQSETGEDAEARHGVEGSRFLLDLDLRISSGAGMGGSAGVGLYREDLTLLLFHLEEGGAVIRIGEEEERFPLPAGFDRGNWHHLRVEVDGRRVTMELDHVALRWKGRMTEHAHEISLFTQGSAAEFSGLAITTGWEDLFMEGDEPAAIGWEVRHGGGWNIADRQLWWRARDYDEGIITKGSSFEIYELVVNARLEGRDSLEGRYGFYPALSPSGEGDLLKIERNESGWELQWHQMSGISAFRLPEDFDPTIYQQFRFLKEPGRLFIQWEGTALGYIPAQSGATRIGLYAERDTVAFDMVRMTGMKV